MYVESKLVMMSNNVYWRVPSGMIVRLIGCGDGDVPRSVNSSSAYIVPSAISRLPVASV